MNRVLTLLALSLTVMSAARAGEKLDPRSFSEIAMIGFGGSIDIEATQTSSGLGALDAVKDVQTAIADAKALESGAMKSAAEKQSEDVFVRVEQGLEAAFGWKVTDLDAMVGHEAYAKVWDEKTPGISKKMAGWGAGMAPTGALHEATARRLTVEERDALMDAMGLPHVAIVNISITGKEQGVSVGGIGTSRVKPEALTMVSVYAKGVKKPVWKGYAVGAKSEEAIKADFGSNGDDAERAAILLMAVENSMEKLAKKFAPEG